jgi:hypothetical protein
LEYEMTDQPPASDQPGWNQPGYPAQPPPPPRAPRSWRTGVYVGLVGGIVAGAAAVGLTWMLSGSDGVEADAEAVCGIIERTPAFTTDVASEDLRRLAVADVGPSLAKQDPEYRPLADALTRMLDSMQQFDEEEMKRSSDQVKELCDDL